MEWQSVPINRSILIKCAKRMICRTKGIMGQNTIRFIAVPVLIKIKKETN